MIGFLTFIICIPIFIGVLYFSWFLKDRPAVRKTVLHVYSQYHLSPFLYAENIADVGEYKRFGTIKHPFEDPDKIVLHVLRFKHEKEEVEMLVERKEEVRRNAKNYKEFLALQDNLFTPCFNYIVYVKTFYNKEEYQDFDLKQAQKEIWELDHEYILSVYEALQKNIQIKDQYEEKYNELYRKADEGDYYKELSPKLQSYFTTNTQRVLNHERYQFFDPKSLEIIIIKRDEHFIDNPKNEILPLKIDKFISNNIQQGEE